MNTKLELLDKLILGDERALSKVLTTIGLQTAPSKKLKNKLREAKIEDKSWVIGITGSPGAGKSTLINGLVLELHAQKKRVAVLAVDPSSPFSGGALLGDRIRMQDLQMLEGVFVRSFASRGKLGGLSEEVADAILALKIASYDFIIIETVGVGQAEIDVSRVSDTAVVVLVPGMGDSVQSLKAGLLEIADIFVINKSDYDGAQRLKKELLEMLSLSANLLWQSPMVETIASKKQGLNDLIAEIARHREAMSHV